MDYKFQNMILFKPRGFEDGQIIPVVISKFSIAERKLVVCEYGFMIGVFDYISGGKICDINITKHIGYSIDQYIEAAINKAKATVEVNSNWIDVLNQLPCR